MMVVRVRDGRDEHDEGEDEASAAKHLAAHIAMAVPLATRCFRGENEGA